MLQRSNGCDSVAPFCFVPANKIKRGVFHASYFIPPPVPQGCRHDHRHRLRRRAVQRLRFGQRLLERGRRLRRHLQLHHPLFQPARHPQLPDHRHRHRDGGGRQLHRHPGRVRQQGRHAGGSGHRVGVRRGVPDLDLPPAGRELGGYERRGGGARHRAGLCGRAALPAHPRLRRLQRGSGHLLHRRSRRVLRLPGQPGQRRERPGRGRRHRLHGGRLRRRHRQRAGGRSADLCAGRVRRGGGQGGGRAHPDLHPDL